MPNFTFRLSEDEVARMDQLAATAGLNRVDLLRSAVAHYDARFGQRAATDVVSRLIEVYGTDATLTFANHFDVHDRDGKIYDVQTSITPGTIGANGQAPLSPGDPVREHLFARWEVDSWDNISIWIEPRTPDADPARVFIGTMLHRPTASLSVKLIDLLPTSTLRFVNADGSASEVQITAAQAAELASGKPIAYMVHDESIHVSDDGTLTHRSSAIPPESR